MTSTNPFEILITGGSGYIGSHTARVLKELGHKITIFDNLENGNQFALDKLGVTFIHGDLRKPSDLSKLDDKNFDACLHFAAYASVGDSISDPITYFENNYTGALNLIKYLVQSGCGKFIFSSTSEVYGEAQYLPIDENHPLVPMNPYGLSKRMVEETLDWTGKAKDNFSYVALRYFNAAGASTDGELGEIHNPENHLIPNAVLGAMRVKKFELTCSKVSTPDETPIRDFVHVEDLADAHLKALEYLVNGGESNHFNIGTGSGYSVLEVINAVEEATGVKIEKKYGEPRPGEPAEKYASNEKAAKILRWTPKYNLNDMVQSTYEFFKKNKDLIKN